MLFARDGGRDDFKFNPRLTFVADSDPDLECEYETGRAVIGIEAEAERALGRARSVGVWEVFESPLVDDPDAFDRSVLETEREAIRHFFF